MLTALFVLLPVAYILHRAFEGGVGAYAEAIWSASTAALTLRTLALVAGVAVAANAVALPLAWLVTRTDLPGRRLWAVVAALPLVFPSYVAAFSLVAALGPKGYVQSWLAGLGVERLPEIAYGYSGALLAVTFTTFPYVYLLTVASLKTLDPALEESARLLDGGSPGATIRVVLPQLRPAILGGSLLACLYTLADFGAVSIARYDTFTLSIYNAYRALFDRFEAAALATVLVAVTVAFIAAEAILLRQCRPHRLRPTRPPSPVPLGRWRLPAALGVGGFLVTILGIPLGVIGIWATRGAITGGSVERVVAAATGTLGVSVVTALVAVALALPVATWSSRSGSRLSRLTERAATAGYALPGIVVALAFVFLATRTLPAVYQTLGLLVAAYVVRFLPEALAAVRSGIAGLSPRFEEAARTLGRGPLAVLRELTVPLLRPSLLAGAGLVFLTTFKELPATLILRPIGFETLAIRVWSAAGEGIYSEAALPALCLVAVSAPVMYFLVIRPAVGSPGEEHRR